MFIYSKQNLRHHAAFFFYIWVYGGFWHHSLWCASSKIPLWCQKASKRTDGLVIWDYHVICIQVTASIL